MTDHRIPRFLSSLMESPSFDCVFNPWADMDHENDIGSLSPKIRRNHLEHYLQSRLGKAKCLIIGEAVGYQGGHFTGIPMTSERILQGFQRKKGIHPEDVLFDLKPERTSKPEKMPQGFTEPTATIVWEMLLRSPLRPTEFVLWNAFPWHPFIAKKGMLSNRKPKAKEMAEGSYVLESFLRLFPGTHIVAMGRVAADQLKKLKVEYDSVRHPARGGAKLFRIQLVELLKEVSLI